MRPCVKALVLGKGKSGEASATLLRSHGFEVDFADGYDLVVASPGLPVKSELQLGCEELKRRGWKLLAVTGSKGKSSVVKLVAEALGGVPCGNYGLPVSEVAFPQAPNCQIKQSYSQAIKQSNNQTIKQSNTSPWAVVEVSSFQLETTNLPPDTFEAAAVLNLQEDHLDRHGSVEVYHGLKRRLLGMTRRPVFGPPPPSDDALLAGSYFDNAILRENGRCAIALMRAAGLDDVRIAEAFARFEPLPHRMNLVAEIGGVRYFDDSKATSVAALVAGVEMASEGARKVRLIAGGLPKGDDPKSALPVLTRWVKKVYLIGRCAEVFSQAWKSSVDCEVCQTMEVAVEGARRDAEKGEVVLLSPGTASFDQFKSFGERGDVFADLVKKGK